MVNLHTHLKAFLKSEGRALKWSKLYLNYEILNGKYSGPIESITVTPEQAADSEDFIIEFIESA